MAERTWTSSTTRGVLGFFGLMLVLMGLGMVAEGNRYSAEIDPEVRCAEAKTAACFTNRIGVVEMVAAREVTFVHAGESETHSVELAAAVSFRRGLRVRVERWHGDVVSLYARGQRYRTTDWPRRWDRTGFRWSVFGLSIMLIAVVWSTWSRAQAASSNGKPWRSRRRSKSRR